MKFPPAGGNAIGLISSEMIMWMMFSPPPYHISIYIYMSVNKILYEYICRNTYYLYVMLRNIGRFIDQTLKRSRRQIRRERARERERDVSVS